MNRREAIFILTFGRPENVVTYKTLEKQGCTHEIYLICSTDDKELENYKEKYGEKVIVFNKDEYKDKFDMMDNFEGKNVVVFARNACWDIAKKLGITHYVELDDDYSVFEFIDPYTEKLQSKKIESISTVFSLMFEFLDTAKRVTAIGFAQRGDYIGGSSNNIFRTKTRIRKIMNTFFNITERKYLFSGRINEDVNSYTINAREGMVFLTYPLLSITQKLTQSNKGGLTDVYLEKGTYVKSFYTVMGSPASTKIAKMGSSNMRIHHSIAWENTTPMIIREDYKIN